MIKKKRLDVMHISSHYPPDIGGLELAHYNIVKEQLLANESVEVVTGKGQNKKYPNQENLKRFKRYIIHRCTLISPKLFFYLLKTDKHIYFVHYGTPMLAEIGYIISRLKSSKLVIFIHMDAEGSTNFARFLLHIYHITIIKFIFKRADALIVPTYSYREHISKKYRIKREKIHTVLYGLEVNKFLSIKKSKHDGFNILFVGNLKIQKNIPLLINAFNLLANEFENMNLIIVGSGRQEEYIKTLTSTKKYNNRIQFIGKVSNDKVPEFYKKADLFVLPSFIESAGIVILEAFAAQVPVIATKCLGVVNLIGNERGILTKNNNVESLMEAIKDVYHRNVNVEEMVKKAYNFVKFNSWSKMTEEINKILRNLR